MLFSWVKNDNIDKKCSKSLIRTEIIWEEIMKVKRINSFRKLVYLGLVEVQTVKIIVLAYVGRVSESSIKKI